MTLQLVTGAPSGQDWPGPHAIVLGARERTANQRTLSVFADPVWWLGDAHADAHLHVSALHWQAGPSLPAAMIWQLKVAAFAMLHFPIPITLSEHGSWAAVTTVYRRSMDLRPFACWMTGRGLRRFCEVTDADTQAYLDHVRQLDISPARRSRLLSAVRTLWGYGPVLPPECRLGLRDQIWQGQPAAQLADAVERDRVNKTHRIAAATMDALLAWALRIVEDIGPDIRDAWNAYRTVVNGAHPHQATTGEGNLSARICGYLQIVKSLPGRYDADGNVSIDWALLSRLLRHNKNHWTAALPAYAKAMITSSGLPADPNAYLTPVACTIDGKPWRTEPIRRSEIEPLIRILSAACFVVTCYLSGMRAGEVLNLRRGCHTTDPATGELQITGRPGKGRHRATPSTIDSRRWTVVTPVHTALLMLEQINSSDLLFPASLTDAQTRRPGHTHARSSTRINDDIALLVGWVNTTFTTVGGRQAIPADPLGPVIAARLRRTLAYFIVRRPRGLIAAALQYGHVNTRVTLSYAGDPDPGWLNDLALERLELVLEQIGEDSSEIGAGEHISGPAAPEYRCRVAAAARFAGRVVNSIASAKRLLAQADTNIHHGQAMTCVYHPDTAVCRRDAITAGLPPTDGPDLRRCRNNCVNLAYTGRDITALHARHRQLQAAAENPALPQPLRQRAAAQADQIAAIIEEHGRSLNMLRSKEKPA